MYKKSVVLKAGMYSDYRKTKILIFGLRCLVMVRSV